MIYARERRFFYIKSPIKLDEIDGGGIISRQKSEATLTVHIRNITEGKQPIATPHNRKMPH